jgi:hypothetical protein
MASEALKLERLGRTLSGPALGREIRRGQCCQSLHNSTDPSLSHDIMDRNWQILAAILPIFYRLLAY